jgi:hypothetical protein
MLVLTYLVSQTSFLLYLVSILTNRSRGLRGEITLKNKRTLS